MKHDFTIVADKKVYEEAKGFQFVYKKLAES